MTDCWSKLGIPPTADVKAIKAAYRLMVKQYHPDLARSPERIRRNTIKCAELNQAYSQALAEADDVRNGVAWSAAAPSPVPSKARNGTRSASNPAPRERTPASVLGPLVVVAALIGFVPFMLWFPTWMASLPPGSAARMVLSGILVVPLGVAFGGVIGLFTAAPAIYIIGWLAGTRFERLSYKIGWGLTAMASFWAVYGTSYHFPFEHEANAYYSLLHGLCKFIAAAYLPGCELWVWVQDILRYSRAKSTIAVALSMVE
jgi:hypothetical protein